jgi:N,N'-diacetyllegionaminate synthase
MTPELSTTRCLVIGEVGIAHDGSLGAAHAFIDAIAGAGADAVKFQTHIASAESTPSEPFRVKFSRQDATRYDFWRRLEFTEDEWRGLAEHARERQVLFLSSPFSMEAVDLLTRVGMQMWKFASGEIGNLAMLDRAIATRRPVILSSGMSDLGELDAAVARVQAARLPLAVLQCTTAYPCPPERVGLNMLPEFRERYRSFVGLSDHSGTMYPALAGATIGMDVFETHVTLSRDAFGPDVKASVTPGELRQIVDGIRFIETMRANPVDKNVAAEEMAPLRKIFTKSVVARRDLPAGAVLTESDLAVKKPGTGIPGNRLAEVIGRRLRRAVTVDELLRVDDLEEPL